jgi:hypothetical protein
MHRSASEQLFSQTLPNGNAGKDFGKMEKSEKRGKM